MEAMPKFILPNEISGWYGVFGPEFMKAVVCIDGKEHHFKVKTSEVGLALLNDPKDYKWVPRKAIKYHWLDLQIGGE